MRKTAGTIFLLFSLLLSLPLCAEQNRTLEPVTLQLQWKDQFQFAGFYAAKEKGFYADAGLDVHFKPFKSGIDIVDEVLQGRADYGLAYAGIIGRYLEGDPLLFLANFFKQSPLVLVTQPEIALPSDLVGKRVMATNDSMTLATLLMMLKKFDVAPKDFTVVPPSFSVDDFIAHEIDAAAVFLSNETYQLSQKGVPTIFLTPKPTVFPLTT